MNQSDKRVRAAEWAGRWLLASVFVGSGVAKLRAREQTAASLRAKRMPLVPAMWAGGVAMELGVAPAMAMGLLPRYMAPMLGAFLVPTTLLFHDFWNQSGKERQDNGIHFFKNLAIIGGLISLALYDRERIGAENASHGLAGEPARPSAGPDYLDSAQFATPERIRIA